GRATCCRYRNSAPTHRPVAAGCYSDHSLFSCLAYTLCPTAELTPHSAAPAKCGLSKKVPERLEPCFDALVWNRVSCQSVKGVVYRCLCPRGSRRICRTCAASRAPLRDRRLRATPMSPPL